MNVRVRKGCQPQVLFALNWRTAVRWQWTALVARVGGGGPDGCTVSQALTHNAATAWGEFSREEEVVGWFLTPVLAWKQ
jgi:hypothetical protein